MAGGLQALTSFTVTADYHQYETAFDVWAPGRSEPAARVYKPAPLMNRDPYQVLTGPGLDEPAGHVTRHGAWAADGTPVGTVEYLASRLEKRIKRNLLFTPERTTWRFRVEQPGLPALTGHPAGLATRLRFNAVTGDLLDQNALQALGLAEYVVPFTFRFDAAGATGFEIGRPAGRSRVEVSVSDPRIDRRLVLACVVCVNTLYNTTVRQTATSLFPNPFRRYAPDAGTQESQPPPPG